MSRTGYEESVNVEKSRCFGPRSGAQIKFKISSCTSTSCTIVECPTTYTEYEVYLDRYDHWPVGYLFMGSSIHSLSFHSLVWHVFIYL